jgi:hypothetical protein
MKHDFDEIGCQQFPSQLLRLPRGLPCSCILSLGSCDLHSASSCQEPFFHPLPEPGALQPGNAFFALLYSTNRQLLFCLNSRRLAWSLAQ